MAGTSLSTKTFKTLVVALSNKAAATELQTIVAARAGTPSRTLTQCLGDALISKTVQGVSPSVPVAVEVLAALTSGAALSLKSRQRILIMMAGDSNGNGPHGCGNELINFIQTTAQSSNTTL